MTINEKNGTVMKRSEMKYVWLLVLAGFLLAVGAIAGDPPDSGACFAGGGGSGAAAATQVCTFNILYRGTVIVLR